MAREHAPVSQRVHVGVVGVGGRARARAAPRAPAVANVGLSGEAAAAAARRVARALVAGVAQPGAGAGGARVRRRGGGGGDVVGHDEPAERVAPIAGAVVIRADERVVAGAGEAEELLARAVAVGAAAGIAGAAVGGAAVGAVAVAALGVGVRGGAVVLGWNTVVRGCVHARGGGARRARGATGLQHARACAARSRCYAPSQEPPASGEASVPAAGEPGGGGGTLRRKASLICAWPASAALLYASGNPSLANVRVPPCMHLPIQRAASTRASSCSPLVSYTYVRHGSYVTCLSGSLLSVHGLYWSGSRAFFM
mmetsp:Transcript_23326/g.59966  ORF Transcript_23326/g.59966 Transcript_23326/m.59966 type:complete len:312 (-) Transcript_23326:653-1588(-)